MRTILLLIFTVAGLYAQSPTWNLLRGINPGQITHVHLLDGRVQNGGFISTSDSNIVIRQRTGDQTIAKDQIQKVSIRTAGKRWRNAGIGSAVGAGVGVAVGCNDSFVGCAAGSIFFGALFAVAGGGVGALFPGYETLFRAPRR